MRKIMTLSLILLFLVVAGNAIAVELDPQMLPFPPNDEFGNYEPTITADGNDIYFARFSTVGDSRVCGDTTDLFVTHRIHKKGTWPGSDDQWSEPERLPDTVNSCDTDQEPRISPDGKTLHWMSMRPGGYGDADIYVSHKLPNGDWTPAQNMGPNINGPYMDHCFMPYDVPGEGNSSNFTSMRPTTPGGPLQDNFYVTRLVKNVWQPAEKINSPLLDSIRYKCRLNAVQKAGMVLGVVSIHNFGVFHKMEFIQYDKKTRQWIGPVVEAPYNMDGVDGACPMFSPDRDKMIWSAGYAYGPGAISNASGQGGSVYDLYWLNTQDVIDYYREQAGLDE